MSNNCFTTTTAVLLLICTLHITFITVAAQRSPYAGARPPNGLNQLDKYHIQTTINSGVDFQNRFGASENKIPYGTAQRPPVGLSVVRPQETYTPLQPASFANRFGEQQQQQQQKQQQQQQVLVLPVDAHGDRRLIELLSRLPVDKRPFWLLNYRAIEAHRNYKRPLVIGVLIPRNSIAA